MTGPHEEHVLHGIQDTPDPTSNSNNEAQKKSQAEERTLTGLPLVLVLFAIVSAMFLVALDRTIIATATPKISDQFHAIEDISWYASAYLVTSSATQLLWGRIYTFYSTKFVFLAAVVVFEVGSAVCGAAPTSTAFIIGRAIAGIGSAGIFNGTNVIITKVMPLHKRPMFVGLMGSTFGVSSVVAPLLGGAFTDRVTWRWCFYINLPIGGVVLVIATLFLHAPGLQNTTPLKRQIIRLDPLGTALFLPAVICFLLALQWGGAVYSWNNGRIIALFVLAGVLMIAFTIVQIWRQEDATLPPRIIRTRSVSLGAVVMFFSAGAMISMLYTLPLWFQGVKGTSAVQSGIDNIPMVLAMVVFIILSGAIITNTGHYMPFAYLSAILMSIGAGLLTTLQVGSGHPEWIGYQALFGFGLGLGMQVPHIATQTALENADVPIGVAVMFLFQSLGGAIWVAVSQSLYTNYLASMLPEVSGIDPSAILGAGATGLAKMVPADKLDAVLVIYNDALRRSFILPVALSAAIILPALGMEWRNVKKESEKREKARLGNENIPKTGTDSNSDVEKDA